MTYLKYQSLKLFIVLLFTYSASSIAAPSMRRCMLLPISNSGGFAESFQVFEEIETFLKESEWCYYQTNSNILDILGGYKRDIDTHLESSRVLSAIAEKANAGSLMRAYLNNNLKGTQIILKIIGPNGSDLFFQEEGVVDSREPAIIAQKIKTWLNAYEKRIPYSGRVATVVGDSFSIDMGKNIGFFPENKVVISRPIEKKQHPLLLKVVDWKTQTIGTGKVSTSSASEAQGKMEVYESSKNLEVGDWVNLRDQRRKVVTREKYDADEFTFGKIGKARIMLTAAVGRRTTDSKALTSKMVGPLVGVDAYAEIWATRNYWAALDIGLQFGSLKIENTGAIFAKDSYGTAFSNYGVYFGYKHLPLKFFNGPQLDAYVGYSRYKHSIDAASTDPLVSVTFSGITFGAKGMIPFKKKFKIELDFAFILGPSYKEGLKLFSEPDSTSTKRFSLIGSYNYKRNVTLDLGFKHRTSRAESFSEPNASDLILTYKSTSILAGATFTF